MPDVPLSTWTGQEAVAVAPFAVIDVRKREVNRVHVTVIVSDGRVFHRDIQLVADPPEREIASELANLLISVGKHEIAADGQTNAPPASPAELDALPDDSANTAIPDDTTGPDEDPHNATGERDSALEVALTVDGGTWLEVGPPGYGHVRGPVGGALTVSVLWPAGLRLHASALPAHRNVDSLAVTRLRAAVGAGLTTRWRHAELDAGFDVSVEPWRARRDGESVTFQAGRRPGPILLGLGGVVLAGWRWTAPLSSPVRHVVIGPSLRVSGSFAVGGDDGPTVIGLAVHDGDGLARSLRLGGLEVWTGLGIRVWFGR